MYLGEGVLPETCSTFHEPNASSAGAVPPFGAAIFYPAIEQGKGVGAAAQRYLLNMVSLKVGGVVVLSI